MIKYVIIVVPFLVVIGALLYDKIMQRQNTLQERMSLSLQITALSMENDSVHKANQDLQGYSKLLEDTLHSNNELRSRNRLLEKALDHSDEIIRYLGIDITNLDMPLKKNDDI